MNISLNVGSNLLLRGSVIAATDKLSYWRRWGEVELYNEGVLLKLASLWFMSFFFHKHDIVFNINKKDIIQVGRINNIFILFWLQGTSAFYIKYVDKEHRVRKFTVVCGWLFGGVKAEEWISNFKAMGVNVE